MGVFDHFANVASSLGASGLLKASVRRANRAVRIALSANAEMWTVERLLERVKRLEEDEGRAYLLDGAESLFCHGARRQEVRGALAQVPGAIDRARQRAEQAAARSFEFFGSKHHFGERTPVDWSLDVASGLRYPPLRTERLELFGPGLDPKYPWALGRLDHLIALGQGYWAVDDPLAQSRFRRQFLVQAFDFLAVNPRGIGIQWASPMEVALRAANLAICLRMFEDAPEISDRNALELLCGLLEHCEHVETHLEDQAAVPNNHLIACYLGLFTVAVAFPNLPGAESRLARSRRGLCDQLAAQVHPDGVSFEGSVPYHRLSTELFTLGYVLANSSGVLLGDEYRRRLLAMYRAAQAFCSEQGLAPQIGDNDSGRVLAFADHATLDYGYLAPLGAAIFADAALKSSQVIPDEVPWLLGEEGLTRLARLPVRARGSDFSSIHGGIHVLRGAGATLCVRAGANGQRGVGGHSHNDQLSFELHLRGRPLIVDSGTGCYTRSTELRNALRSTAAHNTLQIDNEELWPFDPDRLFSLPEGARGRLCSFEPATERGRVVVRHDGYLRLAQPVAIERTFVLDRLRGGLWVTDSLEGEGHHELRSRLHLYVPESRQRTASRDELERARQLAGAGTHWGTRAFELGHGAVALFDDESQVRITFSRYSEGYGQLRISSCLVARRNCGLPAAMSFVVLWEDRP